MSNFELRSYSYSNGVPSITMGVRRQVGSNVVEVMDAMLEKVAVINDSILKHEGLLMELNSDDVQYVRDSVRNVRRNLIIGGLLATLVLFLFLRSFSATITGALGIPICTVAAFLGLLLTGRTINVISLAGIAFAIGMTLDNSIVVLENIYRHLSEGKQRAQAALDGVREVWPAVLASTMTTILPIARRSVRSLMRIVSGRAVDTRGRYRLCGRRSWKIARTYGARFRPQRPRSGYRRRAAISWLRCLPRGRRTDRPRA